MHIVQAVRVNDDIGGARLEGRGLDAANGPPLGQPVDVGGYVVPVFAVVAGQVNQAIVRAGPQQALLPGRFGDGEDGAVDFGARVVAGDGAAGPLLFALVVACQIGTDRVPASAGIACFKEHVAGVVDDLAVVR